MCFHPLRNPDSPVAYWQQSASRSGEMRVRESRLSRDCQTRQQARPIRPGSHLHWVGPWCDGPRGNGCRLFQRHGQCSGAPRPAPALCPELPCAGARAGTRSAPVNLSFFCPVQFSCPSFPLLDAWFLDLFSNQLRRKSILLPQDTAAGDRGSKLLLCHHDGCFSGNPIVCNNDSRLYVLCLCMMFDVYVRGGYLAKRSC